MKTRYLRSVLLSILLVTLLITSLTISMTSQTASALGSNLLSNPSLESFSGSGSGTAGDPYMITTVEQLQGMNDNKTAYYILGNDIDASATSGWNSGAGFIPIGMTATNFTGSFDGRGCKISNLYINRPSTDYIGLFGRVGSGGVVKNVGMENENVTGGYYVGGLVGVNSGTVSHSYSTGTVSGGNNHCVGGLVGYNEGTVSNSYSTGTVSGSGNSDAGGLVGSNYGGTVSNSYSTGTVSGSGNHSAGGLVGWNYGPVSNSYSTGTVSGSGFVGGLVGWNYADGAGHGTVSNCYSTGTVSGGTYVGGLVGYNQGTVSNSFWDNQTSGWATSAGGTGKTTENMKYVRTFTDNTWSVGLKTPWDFVGNPYNDVGNENIWNIDSGINNGYPFLAWQVMQDYLTFTQTGLDSTATGTVENLNGLLLTRNNLPYSIWVGNGTVENFTYSSIVSSTTSGKQFRLVSVSDNSPLTVTASKTVTANYMLQYKLIMATNFGTTSPTAGDHWYDNGTVVNISAPTPSAGAGEQYVWDNWTGTGTGSYTGNTNSTTVTMSSAITETALWTHQYKLTMATNAGTTDPLAGDHWYDNGTVVDISATGPGGSYVWGGWTGTGTGSYTGTANPAIGDVTMDNAITETASWVAGSVHNENKDIWYTTIQSAIANADSGNTIRVYPGTFDEQVVINNKSLTLIGSGDSTVVKPSSQNKLTTLYTYPENLPYMGGRKVASIILVENAGGSVTIENLKVDGSSVTSLPAGASILAGILYGESGGKIQNVTVDNIKTTGYADRTYGIDLAATGSAVSVEVSNNRINDWARNGINANGAGLTVNIHGNTLTGPSIQLGPDQVPNGIVLWADLVGTVSGNTVSSCHELSDNISGTSWLSTGIMAYKTLGPGGAVIENNEVYDVDMGVDTTTCIIRNNNLHGNGMGVVLEAGADNNQIINNNIWNNAVGIQICGALNPNPTGKIPPTANNFAHFNNITGNTSGFVNYDNTQKFDARFNWWGNASGPGGYGPTEGTGDNITENVRYSPWLGFTVGTVPMTFHVDNTGTIQSAIDAASSGDTIIVHSGTYGPFTVNGKSNLTIKAASVPIVEGVQSASTRNRGNTDTVVWIRDSTNIVLVGLDIEGSGLGTINQASYGIFIENSSGTVENCKVSPNTVGNMYSLAIGIYDGSNITIDPCIIENFGRIGIHVYNGCTVNVLNSTIIGQVYNDVNLVNYGIEVEGAKYNDDPATASHATIIGNEIYNCNNLASSPKWSSDAIVVNGWLEYGPEADSTVVIEKNNIHNNWGGIEVCKSPSSYAHFNSIHNNLTYGVLSENDYDNTWGNFNATCNWWGDTSGPYNPTTNPSGLGDNVSDNVTYAGWARAPIGTVWIDVSPGSLSGTNGATLNYTVTVQNPDNVSRTFDLTDNAGPSWLPSLSLSSLTIAPNENSTATFSVTVPSDAIGGTIYNMMVTATSEDNPLVNASASCTAEVTVTRSVSVSISPGTQSGTNGATLTYTVTINNTGNVSDTYTLDNKDNLGWTKLSNTSVVVAAFSSDSTTKENVTIPSNAIGGTIDNIKVTATSQDNAEVKASDNCTAQVTIARSVNVSISPTTKSGGNAATLTYTITVSNTGNVSDNYSLTDNDNAGWSPSVSKTSIVVAAFSSDSTTTLSVTIPMSAVVGTIDNIWVKATSKDNAAVFDNKSCTALVTVNWTGTATFKLENLYKVSLDKNLQLNTGSKLVVKFYEYDSTFQAESVIDSITPPQSVVANENVPQPRASEGYSWGTVQIATLVLTTDDTGNVISTIASFTVHQSDLRNRNIIILRAWGDHPEQQSAFRAEIGDILRQWSSAPA